MRTIAYVLTVLAALSAGVALADPVLLGAVYDPFPGSSCSSGACDVIGENVAFDIQRIEVLQGAGTLIVSIYTNYDHSTAPPAPWSYTSPGAHPSTLHLSIGDLFFGIDGVLAYGVALQAGGHDGFLQGGFYRVTGTQTASDVLGIHSYPASSWIFRDSAPVWLGGTAPAAPLAQGAHQVSVGGNGVTSAKWVMTVTLPTTQLTPLWSDLQGHDRQLGIYFASNTCGNDIISGTISVVPEPGTGLLAFCALVLAAAGRRLVRMRRRR
jgi:hypothetical protein